MMIGLLKKGDEVLNVTSEFVAVRREAGTVDIIPIIKDNSVNITAVIVTIKCINLSHSKKFIFVRCFSIN